MPGTQFSDNTAKNPAKRRYVTSVSLFIKILVWGWQNPYRVEVGWDVTKNQVGVGWPVTKYQVEVGWSVPKYKVGVSWAVTKHRIGVAWAVTKY